MQPLTPAQKNSLTRQYHALQKQNAALEARLIERDGQLLAANANLDSEIADRQRTEDEFRRSTEQLRELSARLQSVREEERTRISRAIHDELGQILTGLKWMWSGCKVIWSRSSRPCWPKLRRCQS
ncbi:MAG: hypothetical protein HC875_14615 [Anaerolineales bacterium]|nr:hypothetical protein [Anaerolineales bacterium]